MNSDTDSTWVTALAQRYSNVATRVQNPDPSLLESLTSLQFASSLLKRAQIDQEHTAPTAQLAVLGPTQSGKSTLVNILLDSDAAAQSALAGFTVHAQGYAQRLEPNDVELVQSMMAPMQQVPANKLNAKELNAYVLETCLCHGKALVHDTIVWDTPDFDSISANNYEECVLKVSALADAILLVVSKDKYADQRVWDMLELIQASGKPFLICVNKVDSHDVAVVDNAITSRWSTHFGGNAPARIMLPFLKRNTNEDKLQFEPEHLQALQSSLESLMSSISRASLEQHVHRFIESNETHWLEPLIDETRSRQRWFQLVDATINDADNYYVEQYLDNTDKYDTFNRALAELLTLLEIPGIAPTLTRARNLITWPARKVLGVGRVALGRESTPKLDAKGNPVDQEHIALQHLFDRSINNIQSSLLESGDDPLWTALSKQLRRQLPDITAEFAQSSDDAIDTFKPKIEEAAQKLYEQLKQQPALLNTLRAARASADAAGVALAVKSGGLAPTDLILAPAMLSVTTLLTESALGRYLDSIKRDLKRQQREHIRQQVLEKILRQRLNELTDQLDRPELLTDKLEPELREKIATFDAAA